MQDKIVEVSIDSIRVSPFQPRRIFSNEELQELGASIMEVGLLHPPVVREVKGGESVLYFELIAGERRWRASKKIGLEKMKVIVREFGDENAAKATLIENVQRVDLDPMETAHAFKKLIDIFQMTQGEVAERVGKKRSTVANYLRLLTLPEKLQASISSKEISMGHAKAILSLEKEELQTALHRLIQEKQLNVRATEEASRKLSSKKKKDSQLHHLEEQLQEALGTRVVITHRKDGSGTVALHYYSLDDLDTLLDKFIADSTI
ncbi:MAG: Stage 0 sporulation protein J [Chlamydiales bacterium]|nr:Stage 0 sporulation protein J [Chlamydiales bacterium]MCH9619698.1 Stage 0 sporulation protein J [Chlamydiales bacterium]MCH9623304.1 Stage 0 sporulation protein J [Chlamydiales bacterium]